NKHINIEIIKYLIEKGINLNLKNNSNCSSTYYLFRNKSIDKQLLNEFIENYEINFNEALFGYCSKNNKINLKFILFLLNKGSYINFFYEGYQHATTFYILCKNDNSTIEMISFLIKYKNANIAKGLNGSCSSNILNY